MCKIQELPVERDEMGHWSHPVFDELGDDEIIPKDWFEKKGVEVNCVQFEYDAPEDVQAQYYDEGDGDIRPWTPSRPAGEGWFIISIHDTDNGPICVWARPATA